MRLFLIRFKLKSAVLKSFRRWSIFASFAIYVVLLSVAKCLRIPLKSEDEGKPLEYVRETGEVNILEYLHRLHNLKSSQGIPDGERERSQPFYLLEETFHKADSNKDGYLLPEELSKWINIKTEQHIHEAIVDNYKVFTAIDVHPKDGMVAWEEYHAYFLRKNGFNESWIEKHSERHRDLNRSLKEAIMRDRAAWSESAKTDPDHLTLDEFLSFRHPESSYSTILSLVDEIYKKFDRDSDDILTEDEFSILHTDEGEDYKSDQVTQEEKERRKEFREMVDLNGDGKATRREMLTYIDPKNPRHAKEEADNLVSLADSDGDGRLSLSEIVNKMDLFLESKMVDTAGSFHDEF